LLRTHKHLGFSLNPWEAEGSAKALDHVLIELIIDVRKLEAMMPKASKAGDVMS